MNRCSAILLAAGRSRRLGFDKILSPLAGRPVLVYSLEALARSPEVHEIILVTRPDIAATIMDLAATWAPEIPKRVVEGGAERQDSVWAGLQAVQNDADWVLIHDAARPLLTPTMVAELLSAARTHGSAVCARPATDTLKEASPGGEVIGTVDRTRFWQVETPQIFRKSVVEAAYRTVREKGLTITDDASAVEHLGHPVQLVPSGAFNLKITRPADWTLLELWLASPRREELRQSLHGLANQMSPLVGYLPLLQKYGGDEPKFKDYLGKVAQAVSQAEKALGEVQTQVRALHPRPEAGADGGH